MASHSSEFILIEGARQNNLKGINLKLPLGELIVVVTGRRPCTRNFSLSSAPGSSPSAAHTTLATPTCWSA